MGVPSDTEHGGCRRRAKLAALCASAAAAAIAAGLAAPASAQPPPEPVPAGGEVRVAVHLVAPFVMEDADGALTGFSIELIESVAEGAGVDITFVPVGNVQEQLTAVESGAADAGIGAISITADREERVDFSQPFFESGIQIAARQTGSPSSGIDNFWSRVLSGTLLLIVVIAVVGTLLAGALVWWLERNHNSEFAPDGRRGVLDGLWWATETLFSSTYGDKAPRRLASRAIATLWMIVSVLLIATLIAEVTADATVERLGATISSVDDLHGRSVVTVAGTTAASYLAERQVEAQHVASTAEGVAAVANGEADAVVADSAILRHLVAEGHGGDVEIVGPVLRSEYYGIALRPGSGLLEPVNRALLRLTETGAYDRLVAAYFG